MTERTTKIRGGGEDLPTIDAALTAGEMTLVGALLSVVIVASAALIDASIASSLI